MADIASTLKGTLAGIVTVAALIVLAILGLDLYRNRGMDELGWSRSVYVFGAVEAIACAGVGWLFGREVHREQAEQAEARAATAEEQARAGEALARSVKAKQAAGGAMRAFDAGGQGSRGLDELGLLADQVLAAGRSATRAGA